MRANEDSMEIVQSITSLPTIDIASYRLANPPNMISLNDDWDLMKTSEFGSFIGDDGTRLSDEGIGAGSAGGVGVGGVGIGSIGGIGALGILESLGTSNIISNNIGGGGGGGIGDSSEIGASGISVSSSLTNNFITGTNILLGGSSNVGGGTNGGIINSGSGVIGIPIDSIKAFDRVYNNNFNDLTNNNYSNITSSSDEPEFELLYRHSFTMTVVYCVAYIIVFIVGLIGNSFVIAVVLRAPRMRTVTNFFIVNLAFADILVIVFCLPATLMSNIFVPWMLGWLMCKTVPYIQGVSVAASVYSLIAVSLDRFLAIWWPLKQMTKRRARIMILCIWVIALGSTIPWALFFDLVTNVPNAPPGLILCIEVWPPGTNGNLYFLLANLVACYLLPMALITICYVLIWIKVWTRSIPGDSKDAQMDRMQQKSKVKVVKMLVAVVILFVLSWLPLYVIFARLKLGGERSPEEDEIINTVTPIAQWLGSSNSCINPILYAFFNKKYRRGFAAIIKSRTCCGRLRYYDNVAIASSSTSTRKSSHYQNSTKKGPCSPSVKSDAVSYIYEHNNSGRKHNIISKQDSSLSRQMLLKQDSSVSRQSLLKQDSHGSRQMLIKQESGTSTIVSRQNSNASRQLLLKHQDSNGSRNSLAKQDSQISYIETKRGQLMRQDSDLSKRDSLSTHDTVSIDSRRGILCKQDTQISYIDNRNRSHYLSSQDSIVSFIEHKRHQLVKQDSVISFADQRPEPRRHQLVKQDSIISFADQRRNCLTKQDSVIAYPTRNGEGHHVSILKKTDSQSSSGSSPRRNIEFAE